MLYEQYGDLRVLERAYPGMKRWIEYMRGFLQDGLMPKDQYADWCVPPESPTLIHSQDPARRTEGKFIGTAYYYQLLQTMARYAKLVGKPQDAGEFETLAGTVRSAFQKAYFKSSEGIYSNGTQTSSILPLAFGMPEDQERRRVFENLTRKVEQESKGHIGVGLVGAQFLMRTLSDNGRADVAYEIATQKTYPGWGYMIEKGATTIWELWNGDTADPAMNSGNHVMQIGDLGVWLYEYLAGIRSDPANPGFKHILIRPYAIEALSFVKASHESMYGTIRAGWKREQGRFTLDVTIPPNTTATVTMPDGKVHEIGSGSYTFTQ
jgi:alpha-L-rhamnosidase